MEKSTVSEILDEIGTLLELKGENPFKCRAYHNAARVISNINENLEQLIDSGELRSLQGIGEALSEKITELVKTGKLKYFEELRSDFPAGVLAMLKISGLGPKKVKILYEKFSLTSIQELEEACKEGKVSKLEGFGAKTEENILRGIEFLHQHQSKFLFPAALEEAETILAKLKLEKGVIRSAIAGSLRRKKEIIGDIDIVIGAHDNVRERIMRFFTSLKNVSEILGEGKKKSSVLLKTGIQCDLRIVSEEEFPFALNYFTGSKEHNIKIRSRAKVYGLSLNEYGFSLLEKKRAGVKPLKAYAVKDESDIYKCLELPYIQPELREDIGEIEAAELMKLPMLIELSDLKGTFHCHTTYSDGAASLEEMALSAKEKGWQYIGIADHSKSAAYANGLTADRVKKQLKEIDRLNQNWTNFRIMKGIEVDILSDGTLDFPDTVLSQFDYVVASVHSGFKMPEKEMTQRIVNAMSNKYVTMLGHMTGRLLLQREPYLLDQCAVIKAVGDLGKVIEINAHPSRLDIDWRMCPSAKRNGVLFAINPDAHTIEGLNDVRYGINVARKGWLHKEDILNTKSLKEIQRYFNRA